MNNLRLHIKNFFQNLWQGLKLVSKLKRQQIPQILENFSKTQIYVLIATTGILLLSGGFLLFNAFTNQGPGPHFGGELTEGLVGQPRFINPVLALTNAADTDISRVVYAQLLKFDKNENLTPDLTAQLPTISKDQKTYTLNLKPNLKWQDNQPLNADDVIFTIQTIQNADFESPLRPNWTRVKVEKIDDLTVTFQLREVSVSFITNFTLGIIPKHIWANQNPQNFRLNDKNLKPVGSGPYLVDSIKKTRDGNIRSISLKSNSNYYQGAPYISRLNFRFYDDYDSLISAYQGKEIQSIGFLPFDKKAFLAPNERVSQHKANLPQYQAVFFNLTHNQIVAEKAVRQALWLATNRDAIISDVYNGNAVPIYGPILSESLGYSADIEKSIHYNLDEAGEILNKAGWVVDPNTNIRMKKNKPLEFSLAVSGNLVLNVKLAQSLQSAWEKLGAKVNLTIVGSDQLENDYIRPRTFDVLLFSENVGADPDPFPFWHSTQVRDPGLNFSGFINQEADKLLTEARQTSDPTIRTRDYKRFQQIINDQLPAVFLVRSLYIYNLPKKIQGVNLNYLVQPSERFADINKWYFQK